jgi:large repetitive protein
LWDVHKNTENFTFRKVCYVVGVEPLATSARRMWLLLGRQVARLSRWLDAKRLTAAELNGARIEEFLDFALRLGFDPQLCRPYRPQTKGRVESGITDVRGNFWPGARFVDLAEGEHTLEVEATNSNDMVEATPATFTWIVAIAPETTIESGPPATTSQTTASIVFNGTDNETPADALTFECSTDNGATWAGCDSPYELTDLAPGDHTVLVRAIDGFRNVDPSPASHGWSVEAAPAANTPVGDNVPVELDLPSGQTATVTFSSVTSEGVTTVDVLTSAPALPAGYLADGALYYDVNTTAAYSSPVTVCFTYTTGSPAEPVRLLHWDGDSSAWVDVTTSTGDGEVCGTTDSLSPFALATGTTLVVPETTIESGPAATTASSTATFFFSTGDPNDQTATYECSLDRGLSWSGCESPHVIEGLVPGSYDLLVRATSTAGVLDTTPATHSWTVVAPDTTIESGPAASTLSTTAEFRFSSTDPEATFECSLDSGTWGSCESSHLVEGVALGAHTLSVRAKSDAGTLDSTPAVHEWTVVALSTTIDSGPEQPTWSLVAKLEL